MTAAVQIRQAETRDSFGIAVVQVDSYQSAYANILPYDYLARFSYEEQEQDWLDWFASEADSPLCVAESESGHVVGYALGRIGGGGLAGHDCELVALHVSQSHQRRGVGRRLVAAIASALRQKGCALLLLWVLEANQARGFYEHLGGQMLGTRAIELDGVQAIEVAYGWSEIGHLCAIG